MAYNTGNPVGSGDPRDLRDNSENLDEAINGTASTWVDRLGVTRKTFKAAENAAQQVEDSAASNIAAIEQDAADVEGARDTAITSISALDDEARQALDTAEESWETRFVAGQDDREDRFEADQDSREAQFAQLMVSGGYTGTGADGAIEEYAAGITVSAYKEIIRENGEFWRAAADTALPYTTTGAGMPEGGAFVNVGDGVLRQDLVQPVATFNSVADMKNSAMLDVGRKVRTLGYYTPGDGGGNDYEIVAAGTGTDDDGSFIDLSGSGLQAKGLFVNGSYANQWGAGSGDTSGATDTAAIQAYWDWSLNYYDLSFNPRSIYYLNSTINAPVSYRTIDATGARFVIVEDGTTSDPVVAFDLNPDADPDDVNGSNKTYGQWRGGYFSSTISSPVGVAAFKVFAIREMVVRDSYCEGLTYFSMIAGLGGHLFHKNRLINNKIAFYCPEWVGAAGFQSSTSITTSKFSDNEFILQSGQKAFYVNGGWERWKIYGGFTNGSENSEGVFHFTNNGHSYRIVEFRGIGIEQAAQNSKNIYFENVSTSVFTNLEFNITSGGDPAGGGLVGVDLENCQNVLFSSGRYAGTSSQGNLALRMNSACDDIEISRSCRFGDIEYASSRNTITAMPEIKQYGYSILAGFNGDSFSSGGVTVDMSSSFSGFSESIIPPSGYTLHVHARDSGSSSLNGRGAEFSDVDGASTKREIVSLQGMPDDFRVSKTFFVPADSDGNIFVDILASGTDTLDIWVSVVATHG